MSKEKIELEKNTILESALTIVGEEGYRGISMRKIGKSCSISHAKIYYYFSNKDEILLTLVDKGFRILKNKIIDECEKNNNKKDKFVTCLTQIYLFGINEPYYFNLMFGIEVPKCSDFLSKDVTNIEAIAQKENAMEFYNYYSSTVQNYANELNSSLNADEILNIFIQISGIAWLENASLLKEIDHNKKTLFDNTLNNILNYLKTK